jgi:hypothetical protein
MHVYAGIRTLWHMYLWCIIYFGEYILYIVVLIAFLRPQDTHVYRNRAVIYMAHISRVISASGGMRASHIWLHIYKKILCITLHIKVLMHARRRMSRAVHE